MLKLTRDRSLALLGPSGLLLLGLCVVAGCVQDPRPAPSAVRRPALNTTLTSPTTPLVRSELKTQADYDALETSLLRRMGVRELIAVYTKLAAGQEVATDASAVLLLQRLAMLHLRLGTREGGFQEAFAIADRLRQQAPKSAHTEFLIGAITALLLPNAADGSYSVPERRVDVAQRLAEHWERLLKVAPDYVGPAGRGATQVREDLGALKAALATVTVAAKEPDAAEGVEPPAGGGVAPEVAPIKGTASMGETPTAGTPPAAPEVEAVKPVIVSAASGVDVATAQQDLHRLDTGDTMVRRVLCRDRTERPIDPKNATQDVVRWVELRCAIDLDDPSRALRWLTTLVTSGAVKAPCRWTPRIVGGDGEGRAALNAAMAARGHSPCPTR
jgi:hypothetical protein